MARQEIFGEILSDPHNANYKEIYDRIYELLGFSNPLLPVDTFSDLSVIYPNPTVGDSSYVMSDKVVYRWNGKGWAEFLNFTILNDVINDVNAAKDATELATDNANTAVVNAYQKIGEMDALKDTLNTNESTRESNEQSRVLTESERVSAENIRESAENIRIANENTRINNENDRIQRMQELEGIDAVQLDSKIDEHKNNTNNPHAVTKAQLGLGNVDNVKQATKLEFDELAGEGRTTETVRGNADAIDALSGIRVSIGTVEPTDSVLWLNLNL